jgi:hypothetical protein
MGDISKTVVVVLLIATILVSVVGTWIVLNTVDNTASKMLSVTKSYGRVSVEITNSQPPTAKGNVGVTVLPKP